MISIEKILSPKKEVATLLVFNEKDNIVSPLLTSEQEGYIITQMKQNEREFFAFNMLSHWVVVAVVSDKKTQYETTEEYRKLGGKVLDFCDREFIVNLQVVSNTTKANIIGLAEGLMISSYTFDNYKNDPKRLIHPFDHLLICNDNITTSDIERIII
ncbi:MAG: hypothetical protein LBO06_04885, partial [Bacteroidales bacterium]|nr:hypothetical protein [Bacteroidales bacterium]